VRGGGAAHVRQDERGERAAQQIAELLAQFIVAEHPQLATLERVINKRGGKVYLDTLQNGDGKLIAAPFCVRALPTAPVSMPLEWSEVTPQLSPRQFTIKNAIARLQEKGDPMAKVLTTKVDLQEILAKL
jgi:bifunctional non-homologous end joining protein LigD